MSFMDVFNRKADDNVADNTTVAGAETLKDGSREELNRKLRQTFDGKIVRKDLTKHIKEGANVPIYVLEYLLGQYCNSDDEVIINRGVETVKSILSNNYVRPDEAQKVLSVLRQKGAHTVIDMITVELNMKLDMYEASFSNLGLTRIPISEEYPEQYDRLLCGGIWCIVQLEYGSDGYDDFGIVDQDGAELRSKKSKQKDLTPVSITKLTPIQMPNVDMNQLKQGRKDFTKNEWLDVLLRSTGMEPDELSYREKWLLLTRMIPLVENNFNLCELGPRSTGKSHLYKEISPNSILISGGQTTVANLFYNMGRKTMGLVGLVLAVVGRTGDVSFAACGGNAEIVSRSDVANPQCVGLCRKAGPFDPTVAARARSRGTPPEVTVGKIVHHLPFEPLPHRPHSPRNTECSGTQTRLFQQCGIASHVEPPRKRNWKPPRNA